MAHVPREASWFSRHDVRTGVVVNLSRAAVRWFRGGVALTHDRIICNSLHFFLSRVCDRTVSRIKRKGHLTLGIFTDFGHSPDAVGSRSRLATKACRWAVPVGDVAPRDRSEFKNRTEQGILGFYKIKRARFAKMREELASFAGRGLGIVHPIRSTI